MTPTRALVVSLDFFSPVVDSPRDFGRIAAANALLKSLEDPRPGTNFVLMAPQRERLFPTLVSRGWVLTLNWPETRVTPPRPLALGPDGEPPERSLEEWMAALRSFLETGHGLFGLTGSKSAVNDNLANALVVQRQRDLAAAVTGQAETPLSRLLATRLGPDGWRKKIDSMVELLRPIGIMEMVRTGVVTMTRGQHTLSLQQAHKLVGIGGPNGVVVVGGKLAHAVGKRDKVLQVDLPQHLPHDDHEGDGARQGEHLAEHLQEGHVGGDVECLPGAIDG